MTVNSRCWTRLTLWCGRLQVAAVVLIAIVGLIAATPTHAQDVPTPETKPVTAPATPPSAIPSRVLEAGSQGLEPNRSSESEGTGQSLQPPQAAGRDVKPNLPHDLSPWGMFLAADIVVKSVMIGLLLASIGTWAIWFAKTVEIYRSRASMRIELDAIAKEHLLMSASRAVHGRRGPVALLISEAADEISTSNWSGENLKERVVSRLDGVEAAFTRTMRSGTGFLASVGATAPFIGLFGTVWGIMNSFIGISKSQTTNLAVVAPGIAEALLATAIGLVAAIPAVLFYNQLTRAVAANRAQLRAAAAHVHRLVSRELDQAAPVAGRMPVKLAAE